MIEEVICPATENNPRNTEASIVELKDGSLLLAWSQFYGGSRDDSGCRIASKISGDGGQTWSAPSALQSNTGSMNVMSPSLLRLADGRIGLVFLKKDSHSSCAAYFRWSEDEGMTWSLEERATPDEGYNVVVCDSLIQLRSGRIVVPTQIAPECWSDREHYTAHACFSDDGGETWERSKNDVDIPKRGAMEPYILERKDGSLIMILRTQLGSVWCSESEDAGESWREARNFGVTAPESPVHIAMNPATGHWIMVWNHIYVPGADHCGPRCPLNISVSRDEGKTWECEKVLEDDPAFTYAYPSITFSGDDVLVTYYRTEMRQALGTDGDVMISLKFRRFPLTWLYGDTENGE